MDWMGYWNGSEYVGGAEFQWLHRQSNCGTVLFRFEREALDWMRRNIDGAPVVADDPHDYYRESGGLVAHLHRPADPARPAARGRAAL